LPDGIAAPVRVAAITALTGPDAIVVQQWAEPTSSQVLLDVEYAGVGFPDVLHTRGGYQVRPELPFIPGWEVSGVVRRQAGGFSAGQRVAAMPRLGGFARPSPSRPTWCSHCLTMCRPTRRRPLNYLTMHCVTRRAQLKKGETLLVHGAAGIGTAACQRRRMAPAIAVVSTEEKGEFARAAGARHRGG
jgi:NADPH2:quinone reductase